MNTKGGWHDASAAMNWVSALVLYIVIWWLALFAVLPVGTHPAEQPDASSGWRGTPVTLRPWMKVGLTTLVAAVVWLLAYGVIESGWISFREGMFAAPRD